MTPASSLDWLYHLLGLTLAAAGLALLLWALFWDRSRGRRRCPKCWYDMAGVPGLRCPECGRESRHEKRFARTRRRRWWAAGGVVLLASAGAAYGVPRYRAGGWKGLVPSTYLVYFAPARPAPIQWPVGGWPSGWPTAGSPTLRPSGMAEEVWARLDAGSLARWQSEVYLKRVMSIEKVDICTLARIPAAWPLGMEVPGAQTNLTIAGLWVYIGAPDAVPQRDRFRGIPALPPSEPFLRTHWSLPAFDTPVQSADTVTSLLTSGDLVVYSSRNRLPIDVSVPASSFLTRIDSPASNADVQAALDPFLAAFDNRIELILYRRPELPDREALPFITAFTCGIYAGERLLAAKTDVAPWKVGNWVYWSASRIDWPEGTLDLLRRGEATITVRGDYDAAFKTYIRSAFDPPPRSCWTGEFSVPLSMRPHPRQR